MADQWRRNDDREGGVQEVPGAAQCHSAGKLDCLVICGASQFHHSRLLSHSGAEIIVPSNDQKIIKFFPRGTILLSATVAAQNLMNSGAQIIAPSVDQKIINFFTQGHISFKRHRRLRCLGRKI